VVDRAQTGGAFKPSLKSLRCASTARDFFSHIYFLFVGVWLNLMASNLKLKFNCSIVYATPGAVAKRLRIKPDSLFMRGESANLTCFGSRKFHAKLSEPGDLTRTLLESFACNLAYADGHFSVEEIVCFSSLRASWRFGG